MRARVLQALNADPDVALPPALISTRIGYSISSVKGGLRILREEKIAERIPTKDDAGKPRMAWRLSDTYRADAAAVVAVADQDRQLPDPDPPASSICRVTENLLDSGGGYVNASLPAPEGATDTLWSFTFLGIPLTRVRIGPSGAVFSAYVCGRPGHRTTPTARIQWATEAEVGQAVRVAVESLDKPADPSWTPGLYTVGPLPGSAMWHKRTGAAPDLAGAVALAWHWENDQP
jgi:hypothetical protein